MLQGPHFENLASRDLGKWVGSLQNHLGAYNILKLISMIYEHIYVFCLLLL